MNEHLTQKGDISARHREDQADGSIPLKDPEPLQPRPMVLPITHIREYDRNPRHERNPKYDEIKASIHSRKGLDSPLVITHRPGEEERGYMVHSGGNTRLRILKELYEETQDSGFFEVHCLFIPWASESRTLSAHLIENDTRGDLNFIDRARAVRELRTLLEQERNTSLSLRQLSSALSDCGYSIDPSMISRMAYAQDVLLPAIPIALRSGLGKHRIEQIRHLETQVGTYLKRHQHPEHGTDAVRQWFIPCLARHDGAHWNLNPVIGSVVQQLAELCHEDAMQIRLDLEALLKGANSEHTAPDSPPLLNDTSHAHHSPKNDDEPTGTTNTLVENPVPGKNGEAVTNEATHDVADLSTHPDWSHPVITQNGGGQRDGPEITPTMSITLQQTNDSRPTDLKTLRARMWTLATQLSQRNGMGECILSIQDGCGFIVDLPEAPLYTDGEQPTRAEFKRVALWWFLAAMAEQWIGDHDGEDVLLQVLPQDTKLFTVVAALNATDERQAQDLLTRYVSEPAPIEVITRHLLSRLDDHEFETLMSMIDTRRQFEAWCTKRGRNDFWGL